MNTHRSVGPVDPVTVADCADRRGVSPDSGSVGLIDAGTVFGYAGVRGLMNVVLFTAPATVGRFIYNQCCDMAGGLRLIGSRGPGGL